jgi:hypothetical protein
VTLAKKLLFYVLMWIATGLALLAGIELILPHFARAQHISHHRWGNRPHTFLPGVLHRAATADYDVTFRANALGFNDVDHDPAKPRGRFRVLLLGDSFVEGFHVAPERHLARLLEGLAARDGHALEVVAMGVSGYGQSHELATYEALGRGYEPDLVIVFFCPNDLWNNLVGVEGEEGPPVYTLDPDGNLVSQLAGMPETPPTPDEYRKHERKPRFPGLRVARRLVRGGFRLATGEARGAARAAALNELPATEGDGALRPRGVREDQQLLFEGLVREMKHRIVDRDARRLLAVIVSGNVRKEAGRRYGRMTSWVAETFSGQGVEALNLDTLLRERSRLEHRYPSWETDAHWNETGHAWVAEILYARLEPLLGS